jgi:hypothetical protein
MGITGDEIPAVTHFSIGIPQGGENKEASAGANRALHGLLEPPTFSTIGNDRWGLGPVELVPWALTLRLLVDYCDCTRRPLEAERKSVRPLYVASGWLDSAAATECTSFIDEYIPCALPSPDYWDIDNDDRCAILRQSSN